MLRLVIISGLLATLSGAATGQEKKDVPKELAAFQGTWKVVKAEFEGKAPPEKVPAELRFKFVGDKVTVSENKDHTETGSYTIDSKQTPAEIDLVGPKGEKVPGIYKFEKDGKLSLCFAKGKDAARPKAFDTKGTKAALMVLEKVKE